MEAGLLTAVTRTCMSTQQGCLCDLCISWLVARHDAMVIACALVFVWVGYPTLPGLLFRVTKSGRFKQLKQPQTCVKE